jgi:Tol biopolymer transport system component
MRPRFLLASCPLILAVGCSSTPATPLTGVSSAPTRTVSGGSGQPTGTAVPPVPRAGSRHRGSLAYSTDDIWVMRADGTHVRRLTRRRGDELDPAWSPDGRQIVYRDSRRGINNDDEIYAMNADGSGQHDLTNNPVNDWSPAWSPDGRLIAFSSQRPGDLTRNIYVIRPDGSHLKSLTKDQVEAEYPAWSPDGRRIAFTSYRGGGTTPDTVPNYDIYVMNADGSDPRDLTGTSTAYEGYPAWSSDGRRIAFDSDRNAPSPPPGSEDERDSDIFVMNADGSGVVDLSKNAARNERYPDWSSDGRRIACATDDGIVLLAADGSGSEIDVGVQGDFPAWRP